MPTRRTRPLALTAALAASALAATALLTGCGSADDDPSSPTAKVSVVASTNVYGDLAKAVGGPAVRVTSILSSPDQDPHSFEADPRTALRISKADLLIENGGGYDDYMDRLRRSTGSDAPVIDVVDLSGKQAPASGELNEHVWYDFPTVKRLVAEIAARLAKADPDDAATFRANATAYAAKVDALIAREATIRASAQGKAIGITEPVPLYLTTACGLVNRTPEKFSEAVEEGDDVAASVLQQTLDLYRDQRVSALVYNEQTSGPVTEKVKAAARSAGIAVVPVTETLPRGDDYLTWMGGNLDALAAAVR